MNRVIVSALLLCSAPFVASAQDSVAAQDRYADVARRLSAFIEHERAAKAIPAISVSLVDGQRIVWARGFGWADSVVGARATASTVYRVGSVSKLFTDIGIMQLVEQRALDLDAPVRRYLPELNPKNSFGVDFTLRHLTSHRAGLTREPPVGHYFDDTTTSLAATVASLNGTSLIFKPGTRAKYSNAGIAVLGLVLERTRRESFYPYLKRTVLEPMGLANSAFEPLPPLRAKLAKAGMWTIDGRTFDAPTFQLGMGPAGSMYSTVLDLGRFLEILFARGVTPEGRRVVAAATLDTMWTPQFAAPGARTGFGIGFNVGQLDGRRVVGHGGAIYGFATTLLALPDDSLGVVVTATLDGVNAVTDHIARAAVDMMLAARAGRTIAAVDTTLPVERAFATGVRGRYSGANARLGVDLEEFDGRLLMTPVRGGSRAELRRASDGDLIVDDRLDYGQRVRVLSDGRIVVGTDTLANRDRPSNPRLPVRVVAAAPPSREFASLIGEYGWDHNVLYLREKDGKLNALIEWFFEYPLERVSRDVYRFPAFGLYDSQEIVFRRGRDGNATHAVAGTVPFKRRVLPADNDRVSFRITPVRPVSELRAAALAASPPRESRPRQPDLVELRSLDSTIKYDIRYATSNNFMGVPFYSSAHAFLQRPAAEAVARAAAALRQLGYGLLIHDAYRPWYVTKMFWDGTPPDKHMFVADPSQGSRHNRGCAVDLTLYDLRTGAPIRMTGGYDEMSDRSYPLYPGGTSQQRWHRDLLRYVMEAQGFRVIDTEWWHFDYKDWREYPIGNLTFEQLTVAR